MELQDELKEFVTSFLDNLLSTNHTFYYTEHGPDHVVDMVRQCMEERQSEILQRLEFVDRLNGTLYRILVQPSGDVTMKQELIEGLEQFFLAGFVTYNYPMWKLCMKYYWDLLTEDERSAVTFLIQDFDRVRDNWKIDVQLPDEQYLFFLSFYLNPNHDSFDEIDTMLRELFDDKEESDC